MRGLLGALLGALLAAAQSSDPEVCDTTTYSSCPTCAFRRRAPSADGSQTTDCLSNSPVGCIFGGQGHAGVPKLVDGSNPNIDPYKRLINGVWTVRPSSVDVCPRLGLGYACAYAFQCASAFCCPYQKICMISSDTPLPAGTPPIYPPGYTKPTGGGDVVCNPAASLTCMECTSYCSVDGTTGIPAFNVPEPYPDKQFDPTDASCNCDPNFIALYLSDSWVQGSPTGPPGSTDAPTGPPGPTDAPTGPPTDCAPGCHDGWPGDSVCDDVCMNAACDWDLGDCDNTPTDVPTPTTTPTTTDSDSYGDVEPSMGCKAGLARVSFADGGYGSVMVFSMQEGDTQMVACPEGYYGAVEVTCEADQAVAQLAAQLADQLDTQLTAQLDVELAALASRLHLDGSHCKKPNNMCDEMMDACFGSPELTDEFYGTPAPPCEDEKPLGWCRKVLDKELCDKSHGQKCKRSCGLC